MNRSVQKILLFGSWGTLNRSEPSHLPASNAGVLMTPILPCRRCGCGELIVFAAGDAGTEVHEGSGVTLHVDAAGDFIAPAVFTIPLQLLAYHVAVLRGTDVDQPRNLAKSVTVE